MLMVKRDRDRAFSQRCRSAPSYLVDRAAVVWVRRRGVGDGHANRRRAAIIAGRACWRVILVALLNVRTSICVRQVTSAAVTESICSYGSGQL